MNDPSSPPRTPLVSDYMATQLITLTPDMDIVTAMHLLLDHRISGAPVVDSKGNLIGVLSNKDCLKIVFPASYYHEWPGSVADYMTHDVKTLDADTDIVTAARRFLDGPYRRFPVLRDGRLAGQISRHDILKALGEQW